MRARLCQLCSAHAVPRGAETIPHPGAFPGFPVPSGDFLPPHGHLFIINSSPGLSHGWNVPLLEQWGPSVGRGASFFQNINYRQEKSCFALLKLFSDFPGKALWECRLVMTALTVTECSGKEQEFAAASFAVLGSFSNAALARAGCSRSGKQK